MSRRTDNGLREAITVVERLLLTNPSSETIATKCLQQLMTLLGCRFGCVYLCGDAKDGQIPWELSACQHYDAGQLRDFPNTSTSSVMPEALQSPLLAGHCVVGDASTPSPGAFPHTHPDIENFCIIPFIDARRIYAVAYICNASQPITKAIETRLRPFVAASSCILRTAEKTSQFQQTRQQNLTLFNQTQPLFDLIDSLFNGILIINDSDNITMCNTAAASMLGLSRSKIIGHSLSRFLPQGAPQLAQRLNASEAAPKAKHNKVWRGVPVMTERNDKLLVDLSAFDITLGNQNLRGLVMDDISERMRSASEYQATLQRFQALTNLAPVAILQIDRNWACSYANDTWCAYSQLTPEESSSIGWIKALHVSDADNILMSLRHDIACDGTYEGEFRIQTPLGRITWVRVNACGLYTENGEADGLIMTLSDITDRLQNERRLQDIAEKDQLTGLINRAFFNDRVEIALKGVPRFGSVGLMFLDLDEFKLINDTLGHDAGDQLLQDVAARLKETLREVDTIARIGGDEFTVLLTNVQNTHSITAIADKLIASLADPFILANRVIYVTSSIGIAVADEEDTQIKTLLKQADAALYKAKDAGRNQYKFYTAELDQNADLHIHLRQSLKETGRTDFRVHYQPQVDALTNKIVGLEALARWKHPEVQDIGPDIFIKMLEESGLITDFSEWLMEEVFSTMSVWQCAKSPMAEIPVSINLSAKHFRHKDLAYYIYNRCDTHGVDPHKVVIEITETALVGDPELANVTLERLRKMGFGVALDDFGTGYSSLVHLRNMPLHCVKIDRSFIKDVIHDEEDAKIVSSIINLAQTLNLKVIAEGVDNTDVKNWLLAQNCTIHQGFHFYKPMETIDIEALLHLGHADDNVLSFPA